MAFRRKFVKTLVLLLLVLNLAQNTFYYSSGLDGGTAIENSLGKEESFEVDLPKSYSSGEVSSSIDNDNLISSSEDVSSMDNESLEENKNVSTENIDEQEDRSSDKSSAETSLENASEETVDLGINFDGDFDLKYMLDPTLVLFKSSKLLKEVELKDSSEVEFKGLEKSTYDVELRYTALDGKKLSSKSSIDLVNSKNKRVDFKISTNMILYGTDKNLALYVDPISKQISNGSEYVDISSFLDEDSGELVVQAKGNKKDFILNMESYRNDIKIKSEKSFFGDDYIARYSMKISDIESETFNISILDNQGVVFGDYNGLDHFVYSVRKVRRIDKSESLLDKIISVFKVKDSSIEISKLKKPEDDFIDVESFTGFVEDGKLVVGLKNIEVEDNEKYFNENYKYSIVLPKDLDGVKIIQSGSKPIKEVIKGEDKIYILSGYNTYDHGRVSVDIQINNESINEYRKTHENISLSAALVDVSSENSIIAKQEYKISVNNDLRESEVDIDSLEKGDLVFRVYDSEGNLSDKLDSQQVVLYRVDTEKDVVINTNIVDGQAVFKKVENGSYRVGALEAPSGNKLFYSETFEFDGKSIQSIYIRPAKRFLYIMVSPPRGQVLSEDLSVEVVDEDGTVVAKESLGNKNYFKFENISAEKRYSIRYKNLPRNWEYADKDNLVKFSSNSVEMIVKDQFHIDKRNKRTLESNENYRLEYSGDRAGDRIGNMDKISGARYDIKTEKGKYELSNVREFRGDANNVSLRVQGEIDSTGEYVIWTVRASHHDSDNRNMYLFFNPGNGLQQKIPKEFVTIDPYEYMWLLYEEDSTLEAGYSVSRTSGNQELHRDPENHNNTFTLNFDNSSSQPQVRNVAMLWRSWQRSVGVIPVPPNTEMVYKIRTKITDKSLTSHNMEVQAMMSKYVITNKNGVATRFSPKLNAIVDGYRNNISIKAPYFANGGRNGSIRAVLYSNIDGRRERVTHFDMSGSSPTQDFRTDRWTTDGKEKLYDIEVEGAIGDYTVYRSSETNQFVIDKRVATAQPTPDGGPYSEAKVAGDLNAEKDGVVTNVSGRYSKDGNYIIWTVDMMQNKKDKAQPYLWVSLSKNQRLESADHVLASHSNLGNYNTNRGYLRINNSYQNDRYSDMNQYEFIYMKDNVPSSVKTTYTVVSRITDHNAEEYRFNPKTHYDWYQSFGEIVERVVTIEGKKVRLNADLSVLPSSNVDKGSIARRMNIDIINENTGAVVGRMNWDSNQGRFISSSTLDRFDSNGNKIPYKLRASLAGDEYLVAATKEERTSTNFSVVLQKKSTFSKPESQWGVVHMEPVNFRFDNANVFDKRIDSKYVGTFADLKGYWRLPNSAKAGDQFKLRLPAVMNIKAPRDFVISTKTGEPVLTVHVSPETNELTFTATEYVNDHINLSGEFTLGPVLASRFDHPNPSINGGSLIYENIYYPLGYHSEVESPYSLPWIDPNRRRESEDAYGTAGISGSVEKEELDEGSDYITYGVILNRRRDAKRIVLNDLFADGKSDRMYTFYGGPNVNLRDVIRIYRVPTSGVGGVDRSELVSRNMVYPNNNVNFGNGYRNYITLSKKPNANYTVNGSTRTLSPGFDLNLNTTYGNDSTWTYVVTVKVEKLNYNDGTPQENKATSASERDYALATRYPTFGAGFANASVRDVNFGKLAIKKIDAESKNTLTGARFALYRAEEVDTSRGRKWIYETDNIDNPTKQIEIASTGSDGIARFNSELANGDYDVVEITSPQGYKRRRAAMRVHVDGDTLTHTFEFENLRNGKVGLKKISHFDGADEENLPVNFDPERYKYQNQPLEGAVYQLYRADNNQPVGTPRVTGKDGLLIWDNLEVGVRYYAEEIRAPEGYSIPEDNGKKLSKTNYWLSKRIYLYSLPDTNDNVGNLQYAMNRSDEAEIWIYKTRFSDQPYSTPVYIEGATFALYKISDLDDNGNIKPSAQPIRTSTTNKNGWAGFKHLDKNVDYVAKEIKSPQGYVLQDKVYHVNTRNSNENNVTSYTITNPQDFSGGTNRLRLIKTDATSGKRLSEVGFELYESVNSSTPQRSSDLRAVKSTITSADGTAEFSGLRGKRYYLRESKAYPGYDGVMKLKSSNSSEDAENERRFVTIEGDRYLVVDLANQNNLVTYELTNSMVELPQTGIFTIPKGTILFAIAILFICRFIYRANRIVD